MSILIKGIKMPRDCTECQFLKWEMRFKDGELGHCCEVGRTTYYDKSDCPLIEVPPHGRLIDADALMKQIEQLNSELILGEEEEEDDGGDAEETTFYSDT